MHRMYTDVIDVYKCIRCIQMYPMYTNISDIYKCIQCMYTNERIIFQVFVVIIMLNLLISLMTTTFARIQRNADIEWKFTRASTWIHYFDDSDAVPVPFNLVPSPYNLLAFFRWLRNWIPCKKNRLSARKSTSLGQTYLAKRLM